MQPLLCYFAPKTKDIARAMNSQSCSLYVSPRNYATPQKHVKIIHVKWMMDFGASVHNMLDGKE